MSDRRTRPVLAGFAARPASGAFVAAAAAGPPGLRGARRLQGIAAARGAASFYPAGARFWGVAENETTLGEPVGSFAGDDGRRCVMADAEGEVDGEAPGGIPTAPGAGVHAPPAARSSAERRAAAGGPGRRSVPPRSGAEAGP